jgi:CMP-N-acetylneuraminic acid synthetase
MWVLKDEYMVPFVDSREKGPHDQPLHSSQYPSLPEVYVQNASLEIAHVKTVYDFKNISGKKIMPFFTENDEGFDVNVKEDWELAKILINNGEASLPKINKKSYLE